MRIAITGTPGVGKTALAKKLGTALGFKVLNEKEFAIGKGIGKFDAEENELVVPLGKLERELNRTLAKEQDIIIEGHLLCEIKTDVDAMVLITCEPERLAARLEARGYSEVKVQDNVFCEGIEYCKKHVYRNYPKRKVVVVENSKGIKETLYDIVVNLRKLMERNEQKSGRKRKGKKQNAKNKKLKKVN